MSDELLAMWTPGFAELSLVAFIALLIFGKKLPKMVGELGTGIREFRKGLKGPLSKGEDDAEA